MRDQEVARREKPGIALLFGNMIRQLDDLRSLQIGPRVLSEAGPAALGRNVIALGDAAEAILAFWGKAYDLGLAEHQRANGGKA